MGKLLDCLKKPEVCYCPHVDDVHEVFIYFTGESRNHILVCSECKNLTLRQIQIKSEHHTFINYLEPGYPNPWRLDGIVGLPSITRQNQDLPFSNIQPLEIQGKHLRILKLLEVPNKVNHVLIISVHKLKLRLDIQSSLEIIAYDFENKLIYFHWKNINELELNLHGEITSAISSDGTMLVIANSYGYNGYVLDLTSKQVIYSFKRGNYHSDNCVFPLSFFDYNGIIYLAHTSDWNQLEIVNPKTGEYVTNPKRVLDHKDENYLDYFFSDLSVSPKHTKLLSNGWVWQPAGILAFLDIQTVMEKPNGSEKVVYSQLDDSWGWDTVWLNDSEIGIERFGGWDWSIPGFTILNANTGHFVDWFLGPEGKLFHDPYRNYLFSMKEMKLSVWDLQNGNLISEHSLSFYPRLCLYLADARTFVLSNDYKQLFTLTIG